MNDNKCIGIFDSGFGGISVLNHLKSLMPYENYIYLGDSKNAPFGTKNLEELTVIADGIVKKLLEYDPKLIVIACGTMSTNLIDYLQDKYKEVHFVGTYPGFEHLIERGHVLSESTFRANTKVGIEIKRHTMKLLIIATSATIKSKYVQEKVRKYSHYFDVYAEPADEIVRFVENDTLDTFECNNYLEDLFSSYKDTDYLVLGCTHFPFAESQIRKVLGDKVKIINGCEVAAREAHTYVLSHDMTNKNTSDNGSVKIIDTNTDEKRDRIYKRLMK